MTRLLMLLLFVLPMLFGCDTFFAAQNKYCADAATAVDLVCNASPTIPTGAAGGEVTDPKRADCVIYQEANKVPIEYCR